MSSFCIASSSSDGLKTWTYGSESADVSQNSALASSSAHRHSIFPRSQLRGGTGGAAQCARFNHNGQVLVGAGAAGVITLWHTNGTVLGELAREKDRGQRINSLYFSSGSRYLATGGVDSVVKIWDLKRREVIRSFKAHKSSVNCVQFSKDADKFVASGAESGCICVFNVLSGRLVKTLTTVNGLAPVQAVSFSPFHKNVLAGAYDDGCVRTWDSSIGENSNNSATSIASHAMLDIFAGAHVKNTRVSDVKYSPTDPNTLLSAGHDKTLRLYDTKSASVVATLEADTSLSCACFFPDGHRIVAGTVKGELLVFDKRRVVTSTFPISRITAHGRHAITSVQVQPLVKGNSAAASGHRRAPNTGSQKQIKRSTAGSGGVDERQGRAEARVGSSVSEAGSAGSVRGIAHVESSLGSLRSSRASAASVTSSHSTATSSNRATNQARPHHSARSNISSLPQSVSVFSAVKKPKPSHSHTSEMSTKIEASMANLSIGSENGSSGIVKEKGVVYGSLEGNAGAKTDNSIQDDAVVTERNSRREKSGGVDSSHSTYSAASEIRSNDIYPSERKVSSVTASTMTLEEQIRNLLGNPSKPSTDPPNHVSKPAASLSTDLVAKDEASNKVHEEKDLDIKDASPASLSASADIAPAEDTKRPGKMQDAEYIRQLIEETMADMCTDLRGDIQNVHLELLRQFQVQIVS